MDHEFTGVLTQINKLLMAGKKRRISGKHTHNGGAQTINGAIRQGHHVEVEHVAFADKHMVAVAGDAAVLGGHTIVRLPILQHKVIRRLEAEAALRVDYVQVEEGLKLIGWTGGLPLQHFVVCDRVRSETLHLLCYLLGIAVVADAQNRSWEWLKVCNVWRAEINGDGAGLEGLEELLGDVVLSATVFKGKVKLQRVRMQNFKLKTSADIV